MNIHKPAKIPKDGYYFDPVSHALDGAIDTSEIRKYAQFIENFDKPDFLNKS